MKRDFSYAAYQELLSLVTQVEDENWCDFTDWFGDRWYDFEGWIGKLDVADYISNVNEYHKKVIDKNDTTKTDIDNIFTKVNSVSDQYTSRFISLQADLQSYQVMIDLLAETITPNNGNFNATFLGEGLKDALAAYLTKSANLQAIAGDGLTQEQIENMDESTLQSILDTYVAIMMELCPDITLGTEIEYPLGYGLSVYYKVSGTINGTGDIDLNYVIQEQQVSLKDFKYTYDLGGGTSTSIDNDGNLSVKASGDNIPTINVSGAGVSVSYQNEVGRNTYQYKYSVDFSGASIEQNVTTDLEFGSVTSTVGIKYTNDSNWTPLPDPVPVTTPYPGNLPEFDFNWDTVGTIILVAGAIYITVKIGTAIVLVPYTGGLSLGLLAI